MAGGKAPALVVKEETGEQAGLLGVGAVAPPDAVGADAVLDPIPKVLMALSEQIFLRYEGASRSVVG